MESSRGTVENLLGAFIPPFSKDEMLAELFDALWSWVRGLAMNLDDKTVLRMLGDANPPIDPRDLAEFDEGAATRPGFVHLARQWEIVKALDDLYDFGMLGIVRADMDDFGCESTYARASAFLMDLSESRMQVEIDGFGTGFFPKKALITAQTGAARCVLEEYEWIYVFPGQGQDRLTIRDMALLAKMEEKSIRNAANRNRPGFLKTVNESGSTWIDPADAKEWLKARGRYLPITRDFRQANANLAVKSFRNTLEGWLFIEECFGAMHHTLKDFNAAVGAKQEREATGSHPDAPYVHSRLTFDQSKARNTALMKRFAKALNLPADLFCLRMAEAAAREDLDEIQAQLKSHTRTG